MAAISLAFLAIVKVGFDGGKPTMTYRQAEEWVSYARFRLAWTASLDGTSPAQDPVTEADRLNLESLREARLRVPEDVSVVGFDDIEGAAYQNPALTTVRQPLRVMGRTAAENLLRRIRRVGSDSHGGEIMVEPRLIIRETTARALTRLLRAK